MNNVLLSVVSDGYGVTLESLELVLFTIGIYISSLTLSINIR